MQSSSAYCPSFGGVVSVLYEPLPRDHYLAIAYTCRRMRQYSREDSGSREVYVCVVDAVSPLASFVGWRGIVPSLQNWIRAHVRFEEDDVKGIGAGFGAGHEVLVRPVDVLSMPAPSEDCDGFSMLAASMLLCAKRLYSLPIRVYFVTLGTDHTEPDQFTHVYCAVQHLAGGAVSSLLPVDASHGPFPGWEAPNRFGKKAYWPLEDY